MWGSFGPEYYKAPLDIAQRGRASPKAENVISYTAMNDEHLKDALKPKSGSDVRLDFLGQSALKEAAEEHRKKKATPNEWSQERQDFLVQSALKEAAEKCRKAKSHPRQ